MNMTIKLVVALSFLVGLASMQLQADSPATSIPVVITNTTNIVIERDRHLRTVVHTERRRHKLEIPAGVVATNKPPALLVSAEGIAPEDVVRLPCRYDILTYTIHTFTGLRSDEHSKPLIGTVGLAVQKITFEGKPVIALRTLPSALDFDRTDTASVAVPYARKADLIAALEKARKTLSGNTLVKGDSEQVLFDCNGVTATLTRGRKPSLEVNLAGECYLVLQQQHVQQLINVLKHQ